ncbi:MAG: diacylglycerol/polyprenol kinase family protein [Bacteroidota bacterium]
MSDHVPVIPYVAELQRKAIHLLALVLPAAILVLPRPTAPIVLTVLAVLAVGLDVARQRVPAVRRLLVDKAFGWMMRPEELPPEGAPLVFNGAVWMFASAAVCAWLFAPGIAAAALAMLMVGDGAAAVIGRRFGRTRWPGSPKSVEGTLGYAAFAFLIGLGVVVWPGSGVGVGTVALGAGVGAAIEALPIPVNDNLRVPVLSGLAMTLLHLGA